MARFCYGYDVVRETDGNGEPVRGGRRINESEAAVVRRIFSEFAAGRSPRAIARGLNADYVGGPGGRPWSDTTIRGHHARRTGVLRNDLYSGRLVWNRQRYVKDPRTGKRLARPNPETEWILEDVPHLRIVKPPLWDAVQARLGEINNSPAVRKARSRRFWEHRRPRHLLTGLVHCGVCGSPLAAVGRHDLACGAAHRQGTCDNRRSVSRRAIEDLVLAALRHNLMAPELVEEFLRAYHAEVNRLRAEVDRERQGAEREFERVVRRLDGLIEAIADGLRTPGTKAKLEELEARKETLRASLAAGPQSLPRLHPNLAELYRRKVEVLQEALGDPATCDEALSIIRSLVERVAIHPIEDGFEIELIGEIAGMVALANGRLAQEGTAARGGTAVSDAFTRSVKVVAGTRNRVDLLLSAAAIEAR